MNKSFTLIEILVVIVVIGVLSAFILVGMSSISNSANIAKGQAFANSLRNSLLINLISEWKLDESTGVTAIKDSWGTNNGTLTCTDGDCWKGYSDCVNGNCLYFSDNDNVDIPHADNMEFGSGNYTISLWFKPSDSLVHTRDIVTRRENVDATVDIFSLYRSVSNSRIYFVVRNGGSAVQSVSSTIACEENKFCQAVITKSSSIKIYINGVDVSQSASVTGDVPDFTTSFKIGANDGYYGYPFKGFIDDVKIFNETISTYNIWQEYFIGLNKLLINSSIYVEEFNQRFSEFSGSLADN